MKSTKARVYNKVNRAVTKKRKAINAPRIHLAKWPSHYDKSTYSNKVIVYKKVIKSMSLDELLEVSFAADSILKGGELPKVKSSRGRELVHTISVLNSCPGTRQRAENINDDIGRQIVQKNKATVNSEKSKRVYLSFVSDDKL